MLALYIFEYTKLFVFFKWNYNIITFLKFKRDYHKNNVKKGAQKENLKNNVKNYIFELFKILQCKNIVFPYIIFNFYYFETIPSYLPFLRQPLIYFSISFKNALYIKVFHYYKDHTLIPGYFQLKDYHFLLYLKLPWQLHWIRPLS